MLLSAPPLKHAATTGHTVRYEYDVLHRQVKVIDPDEDTDPTNNPVWQTLYNAADEVIATIDPLGRQTTYGYDALGTLVTVTTPMDFVTSYGYDAEQRLLSVTDPLGRTTSYERDARGRVISITDPTGAKSTFAWDAVDRLVRRTDPLAGLETSQTDYQYDNLDRLIELVDAEGNRWKWEYDLVGNRIAAIDPLGNRYEWDYDARNRVIATRDPLGNQTTIAYTLTGMVAAVTDPLGRTTRYRYNARDWRTAIILPDGDSDPNNNPEITFGYDEEGNLISLTDADGNTTQWRLDAVDRVIEEINALGLSRFFEHDAAGQLTAVVDRNGRRREFDYDLDGRRTAEKWLDGQGQIIFQINYTWDAANQLIGVSDPNQTYTLAYDDAGRIISLDNTGSPSIYPAIQLTNTYDDAGNRIRLTDNYGTEWRYQYDSLSRMTQAELVVNGTPKATAQFAYDAASRLVRMVRFEPGSGGGWGQDPQIVTSYSYDAASRVTLIDHDYVDSQGNATPLADFAYTWDAAGQIVAYSGPEGTRTYAYDPQGQLTDVWDGQGNLIEYYRYTPNGNRTESHLHGTGYVTGADNRLLSDGTNDYEYDNEGNLIRKTNTVTGEVTEYSWDYRNRLTAVVHKDGQGNVLWSETYVYDAFNRRIAFYEDPDGPAGPEPERFTFVLHDLAQPPSAEQVAQGGLAPYVDGIYSSAIFAANPIVDFTDADTSDGITPTVDNRRLYTLAVDALLAEQQTNGTVDLVLTDLLGSVRHRVQVDGSIAPAYRYDAFGNALTTSPASRGRFRFTGREWSETAETLHLRARAYSPDTGRFLSPDPLGLAGGSFNPFTYAGNKPTSYVDPRGTWFHRIIQNFLDWLYTRTTNPTDEMRQAAMEAAGATYDRLKDKAHDALEMLGPVGLTTSAVLYTMEGEYRKLVRVMAEEMIGLGFGRYAKYWRRHLSKVHRALPKAEREALKRIQQKYAEWWKSIEKTVKRFARQPLDEQKKQYVDKQDLIKEHEQRAEPGRPFEELERHKVELEAFREILKEHGVTFDDDGNIIGYDRPKRKR